MDKYELIKVEDKTKTKNIPVLDEDVRERYLEEFGYAGEHGQVVTLKLRKRVYICPVCGVENVMFMVNDRIVFGSSAYSSSKGGEMCSKCCSLSKEAIDTLSEANESGVRPVLWRTKEELEGHTIIINGGDMFWGQVEHFENCFFDNCSEEFITDWCAENGWSLHIIRGIIQPPRTENNIV